ncbi:MAG: hypothetical protein OEY23_18360, partial [Acidimicrobiia bacterium]|nr:hypothetical protein [Acidimicrobiia bacterium]
MLRSGPAQRLVFGLADDDVVPLAAGPERLAFSVASDGASLGSFEVQRHDDGVPRPYYPLMVTFAAPGLYTVTAEVGGTALETNVRVVEPDQVALPAPGDEALAVATPTVDDARGVDPICTRNPPCPFHEVSFDEALRDGRPTALLVSSPAYCQTAICGPVLENLVEMAEGRDLAVIHAEVYADAAAVEGDVLQASPAPIVERYGLTFEPVLFGYGSDG